MTEERVEKAATPNHYRALCDELSRRTWEPWKHPSYLMFFILSVAVLGAAGIWFEIYNYIVSPQHEPPLDPLRTALTTFFPAIAGSTTLQLIWAESNRKSLRAFASLCLILVALATLITAPQSRATNCFALTSGAFMSLVACWIWWIANADQTDLKDKIDPDAPLGGDKNTVVSATLSGSLNGFDH